MAPAQVHLTIFMLKLLTRDEIKRASDLLQALSPKIYDALEVNHILLSLHFFCFSPFLSSLDSLVIIAIEGP